VYAFKVLYNVSRRNSLLFFIGLMLLFSGCRKADENTFVLLTPCGEVYPQEVTDELLALSDTATLSLVPDLQYRLTRIAGIFSSYNDVRGLFPSVYRATTEFAVQSLLDGAYNDEAKAIHVSVAFGKRYLFNLHNYLRGKTPEYHWKQYYDLCERCGYNKARIATSGINAHLTVDLARAIRDAHCDQAFQEDYITFGEILGDATPNIVQYLKDGYGLDMESLFSGLFVGEALDPVFGENFTRNLAFQFIRVEAFKYGRYLQNTAAEKSAEKSLRDNWELREGLLDELLRQGLLPQ